MIQIKNIFKPKLTEIIIKCKNQTSGKLSVKNVTNETKWSFELENRNNALIEVSPDINVLLSNRLQIREDHRRDPVDPVLEAQEQFHPDNIQVLKLFFRFN